METDVGVRVGFLPSHRFEFTPWCRKMHDDSLAALAWARGIEVLLPQLAGGRKPGESAVGFTRDGGVSTLDEAGAASEYSCRERSGGDPRPR